MKYPRYPHYKPSGIDWLGEVPEHWQVKRLKTIAHLIDRKQEADEEHSLPYVGMENIESWTGRLLLVDPDITPSGVANTFQSGTVLFGKLRPYLAKACSVDFDGLCSSELLVLRGKELLQRTLLYALLTEGFVRLVDSSTYGVKMPRAGWEFIGNCCLPIAPPGEQQGIANFLDRETAKLDTLVAKKQALIEKLKEKRATLIWRAVTRGLPPEAARAAGLDRHRNLKPSGMDWLAEVPEHWETGNLRRFAQMKTGHTPSRSEAEYWEDCDIPWFTLADVWQLRNDRQIYLGETKERISHLGLANSAAELLPAGTVVLSRTASVGFSGIMSMPMATTQHFWNWVPRSRLLPEYLLYVLRAMRPHLESLMMGSTHKTIYQPDAAGLCIAVPPVPEQKAFVNFIRVETAKIDRLVDAVEAAIERLREYRAALITAAVTGKIDVREAHLSTSATAEKVMHR